MPIASSEAEVLVLDVRRGRLEDHLELLVLVEAVRVLAVAAVGGPARGLHVADLPRPRAEHAEEGLRVHRARPHLGVPRLVDEAAPLRPEALEREDDLLERHRATSRATSRITRGERRSRSRWAAMSSRWKDSRACAAAPASAPERVGRAAEEVGQHPAGADRQVGARGRPAVAADEAVRRRGGSERAPAAGSGPPQAAQRSSGG